MVREVGVRVGVGDRVEVRVRGCNSEESVLRQGASVGVRVRVREVGIRGWSWG